MPLWGPAPGCEKYTVATALRGLVDVIPGTRFSAKEHRATAHAWDTDGPPVCVSERFSRSRALLRVRCDETREAKVW